MLERLTRANTTFVSSAERQSPVAVYLGSYRLLLAFLVFSSHATRNLAWDLTHSNAGPVGVMCFFLVSGYIITVAIETHYSNSPLRFLENRALRIYPTLWVSLIVATLIIVYIGNWHLAPNFFLDGWTWSHIVPCMFVITAYPEQKWGPIPVGWTLQVEACFYLIIAAIYFVIGRTTRRKWWLLAACLAALLANFAITSATALWWSNGLLFVPLFVAGVSAAVFQYGDRTERDLALAVLAMALLLSASLVIRFSSNIFVPRLFESLHDLHAAENGYLPGTIATMAAMIGVFFLLLSRPGAVFMARIGKIDSFLGDLTYPLYTLHFAINQLIAIRLSARFGAWTVLIQIFAGLVAAYLVLRFFERPIRRWRTAIRGAPVRDTGLRFSF
jgi:peptidoglycan/LPS O-acetylase OafA/YrhL